MTQQFAVTAFFKSAYRGSPLLWWCGIVLTAAGLLFIGLSFVDDRLLNGASVWSKPLKFSMSLSVLALTMAWAISLLETPPRGLRIASGIYVFAVALEMLYIAYRASFGEASHFNTATLVAGIMYGLMGVFSLLLTAMSGYVGFVVFRRRAGILMREAAGVGLMLGAVLTAIAGGYLSGLGSHWIGGELSDAKGLPFFGWSTTGGDLRVSHFIGSHASQFLPLAALSENRRMVYGVGVFVIVLTIMTMAQAIMGIPLLKV